MRMISFVPALEAMTLSSANVANIEIDSLFDGVDFSSTITRAKFENLCDDLCKKTMVFLDQVIVDSKISKDRIHEIVLVGGTTRIPRIQQLLSEYFTARNYVSPSTPMSAWLTVRQCRRPFCPDPPTVRFRICFYWMCALCHLD